MILLAIDPALKCGWTLFHGGKRERGGVWDVGRYSNRMHALQMSIRDSNVRTAHAIAVEHNLFSKSWCNSRIYWGMRAVFECEFPYAETIEYTPAQWRKIIHGKGRVGKQASLDLCAELGYDVVDDNEAESACIGLACLKEHSYDW